MDIILTPWGTEKGEHHKPFRFTVDFCGEGYKKSIGYESVSVLFHAGKKTGRLTLIRSDHKTTDDLRVDPIYENSYEGEGIRKLIREYVFSGWEIRDGHIEFINCERR